MKTSGKTFSHSIPGLFLVCGTNISQPQASMSLKKKNKPPTDKDKCTLGSCTKMLESKRNKKDKSFSNQFDKKCEVN